MRANFVVPLLLMLMMSAPARADPPKLAVFDFELMDTSLEGEARGSAGRRAGPADARRRAGAQGTGRIRQVPACSTSRRSSAAAQGSNLQACGGCDVQLAQKLGADLVMTGVVQKVSALILNISIYVRDVQSGRLIAAMNVDLRGNTDESWTRATSYLLRNRLLAPNYGAPQPQ